MTDTMSITELEGRRTARIPGDFRRAGENGPPYVLDSDGELTKKGTPRSRLYGRPSGFHRWIDNAWNLEKWSERMVLVGTCLLVADGVINGPIDPEAKSDTDALVARAKHIAGATLAAERGTSFHEATHALHDVEHAEADVIERLPELGFPPPVIEAVLEVYRHALERWGLEVLASEVRCVDDSWCLAGTIDRIARLARDLAFGDITIPAGTVVVLDLKTGQQRVHGGRPEYWDGYSVQVASYAQSMRYVIDGDDEHREPWPWRIDADHALILHLDIAGALDTDVATATLWHVDLQVGRLLGELAAAARDASRWTPPFTQLGAGPAAVTVDWGETPSPLEHELIASLRIELRKWLQGRIDEIGQHKAARADLQRLWPDCPPLRQADDHTDEQLAEIEAAIDRVDTDHSLPFPAKRPGTVEPRSWLSQILGAFPGSTIENTP